MLLIETPAAMMAALEVLDQELGEEPLAALDTETYPKPGARAPQALIDEDEAFLDPYSNLVRLIQIQTRNGQCYVFDVKAIGEKNLGPLVELLNNPYVTWVLHNAKYDWKILSVHLGVTLQTIYCTQIATALLGFATGFKARVAGGLGLKDIVRDFLDVQLDKSEQTSFWGGELRLSQVEYAAGDVRWLIPLYDLFIRWFEQTYEMTQAVDLEMRALPSVCQMELNGIKLDTWMYRLVQRCAEAALPGLLKELCKHFGVPMQCVRDPQNKARLTWVPSNFNFNSDQQVKALLHKHGILVENMKEETLKEWKDRFPIIEKLISYNQLTKQLGVDYEAYVNPTTGRVHPTYNQCGAATGRFACLDPNLQQTPKLDVKIPERIVQELVEQGMTSRIEKYLDPKREGYYLNYRYCFVADADTAVDDEEWVIASLDYSGQEVAVLVALSEDPFMIDIMNQPKKLPKKDEAGNVILNALGEPAEWEENLAADLHSQAAATMFKIDPKDARSKPPQFNGKSYRDLAKAVVFGLAYGKSAKSLSEEWGISEEAGEKIVSDFFKPMPVLKRYLDDCGKRGKKTRMCRFGYGRLRFLNDSRHTDRNAADRAARNTPIQGNSALMMKEGLIKLNAIERRFRGHCRLIGTVHDEALVKIRKSKVEMILPLCEQAMKDAASIFLKGLIKDPEVGIGVGKTWTK